MVEGNEHIWEAAWNDLTICLLKRLYYHSAECLMEVGEERFDVLLKPIILPSAISASHLARKALQIEGDDIVSNARLVSFGHDYLAFGGQGLGLYEKAVVKRSDHCLIQDGPPEVCIHCRLSGPLECSATNPNHIMIVTSSITEGFRSCEWYIKNVDQTINSQKDFGKKVKDLPAIPLNMDQRLQLAREILTYYIFFTSMAIVENFGVDELLRRMRYRMYTEGMRFFGRIDKKEGREVGDELIQVIIDMTKVLDIRADIHVEDDSELMTVGSCPFSGFPPFVCQVMELFFAGICKGHGQGKELVQVERMTEGAPRCRYILRDISPSDRKWSD